MPYGFNNINEQPQGKVYLKEPGLHQNVKFTGLSYGATEQWEYFDIELETQDGRYFRERTFGPAIDKVFPKAKYKDGKQVGMETKEEALTRVESEINSKLLYLGLCFVDRDTLNKKASSVRTFKELVDSVATAIGKPTGTINILTVWKNSDARQKSNLILAERIKWCELYEEGKTPQIKLNQWQANNQMVEKYPYKPQEGPGSDAAIINADASQPVADTLPF